MTYLELCQMVSRESGTVSGTLPASVASQTGRLLKIVNWVALAWNEVQNRRSAWAWMQAEFTGSTTAGSARYTHNSFSLTRWADWIVGPEAVSLYLSSTGVADEGLISPLGWPDFRGLYVRGSHDNQRPVHYAISPAGELCLGPTPDDTYVVRGEYRKSPQSLAVNADEPECPARFHAVIAWYALLLLSEHDEGGVPITIALRRYRELLADLERDQLPLVRVSANALA